MGNTLEQAWQWLVPLVVADSDGKLLPRSPLGLELLGRVMGLQKGEACLIFLRCQPWIKACNAGLIGKNADAKLRQVVGKARFQPHRKQQ